MKQMGLFVLTWVAFVSKNFQWNWYKNIRDDIVYSSGTSGRLSAVGRNSTASNS